MWHISFWYSNFAFLNRMHDEFSKLYTSRRIQIAHAYGMEKTFRPNMRTAMHYYNVNHESISQEPKVAQLVAQVQGLTDIMGRNLNLLLERGDNIEAMAVQSGELEHDAQVFYKKSKVLKRHYKWLHYKTTLLRAGIVTAIVATIGGLLFIQICGIDLSKCRAA